MSLSHMILLGIIALIVIPPEKLPEMARQFAKFLYELKRSADQIIGEIKQDALIKPEDILDQKIKDQFADIQKSLNTVATEITNKTNLNPQTQNTTPSSPTDNSNEIKKKHE